jgi:RHS repeat-associated protein
VDGNAAEDLAVMWRPPAMTEARALCPIRFQGQWEDAETGLHYNRYRTYDPASAQYLSPDPIGIMGGMRASGYVHMPIGRVDPMGLNALRNNLTNAGQGLSVPWQAHHLIPCAVWGRHRGMFDTLGMQRDAASNGIALPSDPNQMGNLQLPTHRGPHAAYNARNEQQVSAIEQRWRRARNCAKDGAQRAAADQRARTELQALQNTNRGIISALGAASPGINMSQCP